MQVILVSGLSGSGKSVALNALEDNGFYCVDNLPVSLLPSLVDFLERVGYPRVALSIDVRSGESLAELPMHMRELSARGFDLRLLFLDAHTDTLVKRFSETRRRHPLRDDKLTLPECIARERELLADLGVLGDHIDTTELSPTQLRTWIHEFVSVDASRLTLLFQSFAYKHGIPLDADLVFDVRCLPNPHYDPVMRPLNGKHSAVIDFLEADSNVQRMYEDICRFVADWLPCFLRDNRSYLTIAIGCTGGQHRSVYFAERLARHFKGEYQVLVRHRELH